MRIFSRAGGPPPEVVAEAALSRGDKVLAHARTADRWLLGTRRVLVVVGSDPDPHREVALAWEAVQSADWDGEESVLTVAEVGEFGRPRATHHFELEHPALLLQLIRERVSASVVLQRSHRVVGKRGFKVIGRRAPEGGPVRWMHEYDAGIDPEDPAVAAAAEAALAEARADVGECGR